MNFIGTLGYSVVLPFLVIVVIEFGGNELIYGILGASYSTFQLIGAPILGKWSDKVGRRKILLLSQVGTFVAWILFLSAFLIPFSSLARVDSNVLGSFTISFPLLLLFGARALDGLTGGNVSVANAYLADVSTKSDRKKNFGQMSASSNLGYIIGPALAGVLGATLLGNLLPIMVAMFISLAAIFVIYFRLKDHDPCELREPLDQEKSRKILGQEHKECHTMKGAEGIRIKEVFGIRGVPVAIILYFLIFLGFNFFYVAFPIHAVRIMGWDLFQMGIFFTVLSASMVLVQGFLLPRISNWFSEGQLVLFGNIILGVGFLFFAFSESWMIYLGVILFALGNGLMWPSFLALLSSLPTPEYQGALQGVASSSGSLASILGLLVGGVIYTSFGPGIFVYSAGTFFIISFVAVYLIKMAKN